MPLDAICLFAVREELSRRISGMKIDKIRQPEHDVLILSLRGTEAPAQLLISAGSGDARVHITESRFENPESPPMFCMLLRKHIAGAKITAVTQPPAERILELSLQTHDALGIARDKRLILELMGRYSNIILTDSDGLIIDCLRRIGGGMDDRRRVLPGLIYHPPPQQEGKHDPLSVSEEMWQTLFDSASQITAYKWLLGSFSALSPLVCRELSWRAYGDADFMLDEACDGGDALRREFFSLMHCAKSGGFTPCMLLDDKNAPREFSYTRILQYGSAMDIIESDSFSELLEGFFARSSQITRVSQRAATMTKSIKNAHSRLLRKLEAQRLELLKTRDRDYLRECGDIVTANLHSMEKGMHELSALDFYAEDGAMRRIKLDTLKTPQQNAARYYKDYAKAKNAEKFLTEQIMHGESELLYLESVLEEIAMAEGESDLAEIRRELCQTGYIRSQKQEKGTQRNAQRKAKTALPMKFVSSSGMEILVGRNNAQNDALTLKAASKTDVWLHAKNIPGSHVVISCAGKTPDEVTLGEAAVIAAFYSRARDSGKAAVDYCLVKHVKKPPSGRPGAVIYTDYKTILTTPDEALVKRLNIV